MTELLNNVQMPLQVTFPRLKEKHLGKVVLKACGEQRKNA
jgi:hypothetical protein